MRSALAALAAFILGMGTAVAQVASYTDVHDFGGTASTASGASVADGSRAFSAVTFDKAGNLYGVCADGGANSGGMLFVLTAQGHYFDLHDFGGTLTTAGGESSPDGTYPYGAVTFDSFGNMYGATSQGGANDGGIVWEITGAGNYLDLHDFGGTITNASGKAGPDGSAPLTAVTLDKVGNIFGTTSNGGPNPGSSYGGNAGILWEITNAGGYVDLHDFGGTITLSNGKAGPDGVYSQTPVLLDAQGDLYGAAYFGGPNPEDSLGDNAGMLWRLSATGIYTDLHDFGGTIRDASGKAGPDGACPCGNLALDSAGSLYGLAREGGPNEFGPGIIWKLTRAGAYADLHDFGGVVEQSNGNIGADGLDPTGGVTLDAYGNLFGTTFFGGPNGALIHFGMMWELTATGHYYDLHDFGGKIVDAAGGASVDGIYSAGAITFDAGGHVWATTEQGGPNSGGMLCEATVIPSLEGLSFAEATVVGSSLATGTVTLNLPAPKGGTAIELASQCNSAFVPASIIVSAGKSTATFAIKTLPVAVTTNATISATYRNDTKSGSFSLIPPSLSALNLNRTTVTGGYSVLATIGLNGLAPDGGIAVSVTSDSPYATVRSSQSVPAGSATQPVGISTKSVLVPTLVTITAKAGSISKQATFTIEPAALSSISLSPNEVTGGNATSGYVLLSGVAPSGGITVTLKSSSKDVSVPRTITILPGQASAPYNVNTPAVSSKTKVSIVATYAGKSLAVTLTLDP